MVCQTKTMDGTCSTTAGSSCQDHRILPQSVPDISQSHQEKNMKLWLKIYWVADEHDCKVELILDLFCQPFGHLDSLGSRT